MAVRKLSLIDLLDYVWLILIILQCHSIYTVSSEPLNLTLPLLFTTVALLLLNLSRFTLSIELLHKQIYTIGLYVTLLVVFFLTNVESNFTISNIIKYFVMLSLFLILNSIYINKNRILGFLSKLVKIVAILSVISLFFWLFGTLFNVVHPTSTVINQWSGNRLINSYYNLYFETQKMSFLGFKVIRNSGMFAESPIWGLILSFAYIIDLFILKSSRNFSRNIIILTMLTTFSTTGLIIIGISNIYKMSVKRSKKKFLLFPVILSLGFSIFFLLNEKSETISASLRADDYNIGFKAWKASLLVGHGLNNGIPAIQSYIPTSLRTTGYSNTIFVILAQGGLFLFLIYFTPMILLLFRRKMNFDVKFAIILFFTLVTTIIFDGTYLFIWCLALSYSYFIYRPIEETGM